MIRSYEDGLSEDVPDVGDGHLAGRDDGSLRLPIALPQFIRVCSVGCLEKFRKIADVVMDGFHRRGRDDGSSLGWSDFLKRVSQSLTFFRIP